ncbi:hypothetical protein LINPERPRIM_LOCUS19296 [Linum perenne]
MLITYQELLFYTSLVAYLPWKQGMWYIQQNQQLERLYLLLIHHRIM